MNAFVAVMSSVVAIFAWLEHSKRGASAFAWQLAGAAVVFAIIATARHIMLARTRRAYEAALATYEAALTQAAD